MGKRTTPPGRVTVENVNVPGHSVQLDAAKYEEMRKAILAVLPKDAPGFTQTEIRKAVAYVKLESARAATDGKKALNASAQELETLAKEVEKGAVKDVKRLDDAFARADHALAKSHYVKASESWTKKFADKTGYELKAAAESLEKAASWAGGEASSARRIQRLLRHPTLDWRRDATSPSGGWCVAPVASRASWPRGRLGYPSSQPLRYSGLIRAATPSPPRAVRVAASHSTGRPVRIATFPSRNEEVSSAA